jgi:hypothetical protein
MSRGRTPDNATRVSNKIPRDRGPSYPKVAHGLLEGGRREVDGTVRTWWALHKKKTLMFSVKTGERLKMVDNAQRDKPAQKNREKRAETLDSATVQRRSSARTED